MTADNSETLYRQKYARAVDTFRETANALTAANKARSATEVELKRLDTYIQDLEQKLLQQGAHVTEVAEKLQAAVRAEVIGRTGTVRKKHKEA